MSWTRIKPAHISINEPEMYAYNVWRGLFWLLIDLPDLDRLQHIEQEIAGVIFNVIGDEMAAFHLVAKHILDVILNVVRSLVNGYLNVFLGKPHQIELR